MIKAPVVQIEVTWFITKILFCFCRLSHKEAGKVLSGFESDFIKRTVCKVKKVKRVRCNWRYPYRTITGVCNNILRPFKGATNTPFKRLLFPDYADGISKPRQSRNEFPLPNARLFSFKVSLALLKLKKGGKNKLCL